MREVIVYERSSYFPHDLFRKIPLAAAIDQMKICREDLGNLEEFLLDTCKKTYMPCQRFQGRMVVQATGRRHPGIAKIPKGKPNKAMGSLIAINSVQFKKQGDPGPEIIEHLWKEQSQGGRTSAS